MMNWEVIPEIVYDLVARVVPGSLLLMTAVLVSQGPEKGLSDLLAYASSAGFGSVLAIALVAYFSAVVLTQVWSFLELSGKTNSKGTKRNSVARSTVEGSSEAERYRIYSAVRVQARSAPAKELPDERIILSCIGRTLPKEGLRLLKIQAETRLCEVVLPGLIVLILFDSWLLINELLGASNVPYESFGRAWLLLVMVASLLAFFRWRADLKKWYNCDLCALWRLLEVSKKDFVFAAEKEG